MPFSPYFWPWKRVLFFYRTKEEGGGDRSVLNRGNSVGDLASLAPFLFIISFVAPFHLRPPRVTFGQLGKYCRELAPRNCEILLHPCPLPFPSVYIRDNKLARLGSALKPRFYLVMDRNEHLWMAREALGRRRLCELDLLSPKMRPFLFPSRSFIKIKFKKSTRENFYVNL